MRQWSRIQLLSVQAPMRHMLVHDGDETIVMMPLDEMGEFVNDNVLQALYRFLYELKV
jgi:hypothetical protein